VNRNEVSIGAMQLCMELQHRTFMLQVQSPQYQYEREGVTVHVDVVLRDDRYVEGHHPTNGGTTPLCLRNVFREDIEELVTKMFGPVKIHFNNTHSRFWFTVRTES
jgi:hypothetical protein